MLTIEHNRVEEETISVPSETSVRLHFPCGLLGFEQIKAYTLHAFDEIKPFLWLEAQNGSNLCFLVTPPLFVVEYYHIDLTDEDVAFLGLARPEDAVILNIATFHSDGTVTVNLKGPIVYNRQTFVSRQVVPRNAAALSLKHPVSN